MAVITSIYYRLFGLRVVSSYAIPHLHEIRNPPGPADIHIHMGAVPATLANPVIRKVFYQIRGNTWLMTAERIAGARFLVRDGCEIVVERVDQNHNDVLGLFMLGSCMGALLLQRGSVSLHGNTLATEKGAIVLAGPISAGKSSLSLALLDHGYHLLSDDLSAVELTDDDTLLVQPGYPRLKLWADTCQRFGIDTNTLSRIRPELEKFYYPVEKAFCTESLPLHSMYLLTPAPRDEPTLEPLTGVNKLKELQAQLFKVPFTEAQRNWPWLFGQMTAIARQTRICLLRRPKDGFQVDELAELILEDLTR